MQLPITRLDPDLPLPRYARAGDAGLDLHARQRLVLPAGARALMPTGIADSVTSEWVATAELRVGVLRDRHDVHFEAVRDALHTYLGAYYGGS